MVKAKTFREDLYYRLNVVRIRMPALRDRIDDIPQIVDFCVQNLFKQKKARINKVSPEALGVLVRYRWPGNVRELENVIYRSAVIAQGDTILLKDLPQEIRDAVGIVQPAAAVAGTVVISNTNPPFPVGTTTTTTVGASTAPFDPIRPAAATDTSVTTASKMLPETVAPATATAPMTVEGALDYLHVELSKFDEPILSRFEREMIHRVLRAEDGNMVKASEKLGMTRATLRKRIDELGLKI
jgi:two-component system nitrogen regulation response regulator GlnG